MEETQQRLTTFGKFGIGDIRVFRDSERDDQAAAPHMERGEGRAAFPDQIVEAGKPLPRDRLVDPALFIARREPWGDDLPDPRAREIEHLQAGPLGQSFGKELSQRSYEHTSDLQSLMPTSYAV